MRLSIAEIAELVGGEIVHGPPDLVVRSWTTDSRVAGPGACFFALRGERDGHDFVVDALCRGAVAAVVARVPELEAARPERAALIRVADPLEALGALASIVRTRVEATVVGISGSVGKTATKDLAAAALATTRRVHASPASFNNEVGVPLTLLAAPDDVDVVVAEMGARRVGDLSALCRIARPRVGAITNIGVAHAALLGGPEGVARAKGELLEALPEDGVAVLNADDSTSPALAGRTNAPILTVGTGDADVRYGDVHVDDELRPRFELSSPSGTGTITLSVRGVHQVPNAAMAATIAFALGVPFASIAAGLASATSAARRMELHRSVRGISILDDTYNANPASTAAALRALARLPASRRVAVLGEMLELGDAATDAHVAVGRVAAGLGLDLVIVVGVGARALVDGVGASVEVIEVSDRLAAAELVRNRVEPGDAVLVKASRAVGLETVVASLLEDTA